MTYLSLVKHKEFKDNVIRFLDRCVEKDLHLNADKFKLDCDTVTFFGHLLTKDGMKPDPKKSEGHKDSGLYQRI